MKDFDYVKYDKWNLVNDLKERFDELNVRKILKTIYRYERREKTSLLGWIKFSKDFKQFKRVTRFKARGIGEKSFIALKEIIDGEKFRDMFVMIINNRYGEV